MHAIQTQTSDRAAPLAAYEREAVCKRIAQINVALGHPKLTAAQAAALRQERLSLEGTLKVSESVSEPKR